MQPAVRMIHIIIKVPLSGHKRLRHSEMGSVSAIRIGSYRGHGLITKFLKESAESFTDIGYAFPGRYRGSTIVHYDCYERGQSVESLCLGQRFERLAVIFQQINPELLNLFSLFLVLYRQSLTHKKYDILVVTSLSPVAFLLRILRVARRTVLVSDDVYKIEGSLFNRIIKSYLTLAEKYFHNATSEVWYASTALLLLKRRQRIVRNARVRRRVVPHGVDLSWSKWRQEHGVEDGVVAYFGAVVPNRGLEILIDSMSNLVKVMPQAKLRIVGDSEPSYEVKLRKRVRALNLDEHVKFVEPGVTDAEDLASIANCSIGCAIYDSRQLSILYTDSSKIKKYLGCGLPIVMSDRLPYARELVNSGVALAVENEAPSVTQALAKILSDKNLQLRMSTAAISYGSRFEYQTVYNEAFESLLAYMHS